MIELRTRAASGNPVGVAGKSFTTLFLLFFLGMGLAFVWLVVRDASADIKTWGWKKTDCEIISSAVRDTNPQGQHTGNFYFDVHYRYSFGGLDFSSDHLARKPESFSDYGKAARLVARYQPETRAVCYVNPSAPGEAILKRATPWLLLIVFFPMIFVAIGAGGIYLTWRTKAAVVQSISDRANPVKGTWFAVCFFSVFLLLGGAFFCAFFLVPAFHILGARSWPAVPCSIISSEVRSISGSKGGSTYSVNILYSYEIDGHEFKANRYHFLTGSSSGYTAKQQVVRQHPPGSQAICYVNPNDPTDAVLNRGFSGEMFFGLIPLVFVLVGGGGIFRTLTMNRNNGLAAGGAISTISPRRSKSTAIMNQLPSPSGTLLLKPRISPVGKVFGMLAVMLFWNGIVSVFVREAFGGWRTGHTEWFLVIFLIPFVLIGLALIGGFGYFLLAFFNPRPKLRVTPGAVPLGGTLRVQWEISGRVGALQRLHLRLEGREEATYRRGTTVVTDKSVFAAVEIASVTNPQDLRNGSGTVTIPANLMHSFSARNNKIIWCFRVHGEISRWPDVREEYPVTVLPAAPATPSA